MLELTRDEAALVDYLRICERPLDDAARALGSDPETVRTLIHRTNRTAGREIIRTRIDDGHTICTLTKDIGEYRILSSVRETMGEVAVLRHETNWKLVAVYVLGSVTLAVLTYFVGYYQATLHGGLVVSLDDNLLKSIFEKACSK